MEERDIFSRATQVNTSNYCYMYCCSLRLRACPTHRRMSVSKRLESIVQTDIKTYHTTHRQGSVSKLFNTLYAVRINYK
jgi:hypothetical protein